MSNEQRDKEAGKPESQTLEVDKERDSLAPKKTDVIEDQEINDCKLIEPIKNIPAMKVGDQESDPIVLDPEPGTKDIQGNEVKIEENNVITNEKSDHNLPLPDSEVETVRVSTLTNREALISKKLTKSDLSGNGLWLPPEQVREKLHPHIPAPALGEEKSLILVDHNRQEWDHMLLVCENEDLYFLKGHWYEYAEVYNLAVSDTIVIERVRKLQVKEELDFFAMSEIDGHDWNAIFPLNSTWQIEEWCVNAEGVKQPDELAADPQIEIRDIGKGELLEAMYEITIKRGTDNTTRGPE